MGRGGVAHSVLGVYRLCGRRRWRESLLLALLLRLYQLLKEFERVTIRAASLTVISVGCQAVTFGRLRHFALCVSAQMFTSWYT